jgi:hypothetical protein
MTAHHPPTGHLPRQLLRFGVALLLWATVAGSAAAPAGWVVTETLGIAIALPPGNAELHREGDSIVLGDVEWERFLVQESSDAPAGLLVEITARIGSELARYRDDPKLQPLGEARIAGILFDVYLGRDSVPSGAGPVPIIGRALLGRTPIAGGHHLMIGVTHAGLAEVEALAAIDAVIATIEARDAALTRDTIPITHGLSGMLAVEIPLGMHRNWDRDTLFRIQTDDSPYSYLQVKVGDQDASWESSASQDLQIYLEWLSEAHRIERQTFLGEAVIAIELEQPGRLERVLVFERCLPEEQLVVLTTDMYAMWRGEQGLPVETFHLTLPEGAAPCNLRVLDELRSRLSTRGATPEGPGAAAPTAPLAAFPAGEAGEADGEAGETAGGKLSASTPRLEIPLDLPHPGDVRVRVEGEPGLSLYLRLIDVNGSGVLASDTSGSLETRTVEALGLAPGTYLVRVDRQAGEGSFTLAVAASAPRVASEAEPNDSVDRALPIPVADPSHALLGYGNAQGRDTEDFFALTLPDDGDLQVALVADEALTLTLRLLDVNGSSVIHGDTSGTSSQRRVEGRGLAAGTYFLRVSRQAGQGAYTLAPDFTPVGTATDPEPNDRVEQAVPIPHDAPSSGRLGYGHAQGRDTEDFFALTLPDDGDLRLTLQADPDLALSLRLLDVNGTSVIQGDTSGTSPVRRIDAQGLAAGDYFVRISRQQGQGGYLLTPTLSSPAIPSDREPNHAPTLAAQLPPIDLEGPSFGRLGYGNAHGRDTDDYFAIALPDDGDLRLTIEAEAGLTIYARLIDVTGSHDLHSDSSATETRRRVEGLGLAAGTYFLRVTRHQGQGVYQVTPSFTPARASGDQEPNDHAVMAAALPQGATVEGRLGYGNHLGRDTEDYFAITLPAGGSLQVRVEAEPSLQVYLRLHDRLGTGTIHADTSGSSHQRLVEGNELPPGTYFIRVSRHTGQGSYRLTHELR